MGTATAARSACRNIRRDMPAGPMTCTDGMLRSYVRAIVQGVIHINLHHTRHACRKHGPARGVEGKRERRAPLDAPLPVMVPRCRVEGAHIATPLLGRPAAVPAQMRSTHLAYSVHWVPGDAVMLTNTE